MRRQNSCACASFLVCLGVHWGMSGAVWGPVARGVVASLLEGRHFGHVHVRVHANGCVCWLHW
jgi:hypothetical protein